MHSALNNKRTKILQLNSLGTSKKKRKLAIFLRDKFCYIEHVNFPSSDHSNISLDLLSSDSSIITSSISGCLGNNLGIKMSAKRRKKETTSTIYL